MNAYKFSNEKLHAISSFRVVRVRRYGHGRRALSLQSPVVDTSHVSEAAIVGRRTHTHALLHDPRKNRVRPVFRSRRFPAPVAAAKAIAAAVVLLAVCGTAPAQSITAPPADAYIIPAPQPFTVDVYSAIQAMAMLKRVGLIELRSAGPERTVRPTIIAVRTVWAVDAGTIDSYPPGHRQRFNIILNGEPLDWNRAFINYGDGMINLRALFTYRNQYPTAGLKLRD